MSLARDDVLEVLKTVADPIGGRDIVAAGMVRALTVEGGAVRFVLEIDPARAGTDGTGPRRGRGEARARCRASTPVSIVMTAHRARRRRRLTCKTGSAGRKPQGPEKIPGVDRIVAIASGKGGVGKSTVSANLATALAAEGRAVGLLDADVYGPSQPRMLGVSGRPASPDGKTILPLRNHGVTLMSLGLMTHEDEAVVWRGPMLMGALQQMLFQVQWGALDVLDRRSAARHRRRADDAGAEGRADRRDHCLHPAGHRPARRAQGHRHVQQDGHPDPRHDRKHVHPYLLANAAMRSISLAMAASRAEAEKLGVPLLAEIPLHLDIRTAADGGAPIVVSKPASPQARAFRDLATRLDRGQAGMTRSRPSRR